MRVKVFIGLVFLLLAGCWVANGQTIIGRPIKPLNSGEVTPESISGLYYYWRYTDIDTNNAVVTNWIDRIQGAWLTNAATSERPTNTSLGMYFNGAQRLTNTPTFSWEFPVSGTGIGTFWMVFLPESPATIATDDIEVGIVAGDSGGYGMGVTSQDSFVTGRAGEHQLRYYGSGGTTTNGILGTYYSAGTLKSVGMTYQQGGTNDVWTNGVRFATYSVNRGVPVGNQSYVGSSGNTNYFRGHILELGWWTNHLTQTDFENLHTYSSNHYNAYMATGSGDAFDSVTVGALRSDFSGGVGFAFYATANATITHLARWKVAGNTQTHTLRIRNAAGTDLGNVSANMNTAVGDAQWHFYALASPVSITAGTRYWILSDETSGGDQWRDNISPTQTPVFSSAFNRLLGTEIQAGFYSGTTQVTTSYLFGPTNFRFTVP
jgi:hypothetical protein